MKTNFLTGFYFMIDIGLTGASSPTKIIARWGTFFPAFLRSRTFSEISFLMSVEILRPSMSVYVVVVVMFILPHPFPSPQERGEREILFNFQHSHKRFLRNFYVTYLPHAFLSFLLFFQEFTLTRDIATITFANTFLRMALMFRALQFFGR
jgi:hypothetical protein